jgi:hypothetical protein
VDLTSSMTPFLEAARGHMLRILGALTAGSEADLRVALVGYQDYGGRTKPVRVHPFRADPEETRRTLVKLKVGNSGANTDAAEAVFAGLTACLEQLIWRSGAVKVLLLIGDAPPHGCGANGSSFPDRYPDGDPSGQTLLGMSAAVEAAGVTLHALGMLPSVIPQHDPVTERCFEFLASTTGGTYRRAQSARDALAVVEAVGKHVFGEMDFDRRVWGQLAAAGPEGRPAAGVDERMPELQQALGASPCEIHAAVERLRKRGLRSK